jgi:hypothetical protein
LRVTNCFTMKKKTIKPADNTANMQNSNPKTPGQNEQFKKAQANTQKQKQEAKAGTTATQKPIPPVKPKQPLKPVQPQKPLKPQQPIKPIKPIAQKETTGTKPAVTAQKATKLVPPKNTKKK